MDSVKKTESGENTYESVYRGRPLNGKRIDLRDNKAVVMHVRQVQKSVEDQGHDVDMDDHEDPEDQQRKVVFRPYAVCKSATVWHYDKSCDDSSDAISRSILHLKYSNILHSED